MPWQKRPRNLTIFEGSDGAGKTTLSRSYAKLVGARYVHHGPYLSMSGAELFRLYAGSVLPAVLGEEAVVLDRSWISEPIYARRVRKAEPRLARSDVASLERFAARAASLVVLVVPGYEVARSAWAARRSVAGGEYVEAELTYSAIYSDYLFTPLTSLPTIVARDRSEWSADVDYLSAKLLDRIETARAPGPRTVDARGALVDAATWVAP